MISKEFLLLFLLYVPYYTSLDAVFEHHRAYKAYKNNDLETAAHHLDTILTNNPDDHESLYNAGKVAYKQKNFSKAEAYFSKATGTNDATLQEKAYYDKGNSQLHQQKLLDAKKSFEEVLRINPHNEAAQKTLEYIKKALEEQKKKEEQKKQQDQQKKDQNDKEQQDQKNQQKQDENQQSNNEEQEQQKNKNDKNDQPPQQKQNDNNQQEQSQQKQNDEQEKKQQQEQSQSANNQSDEQENQNNNQNYDEQKNNQNKKTQQSPHEEERNTAEQQQKKSHAIEKLDKQSAEEKVKQDKGTLLLEKLEKEDAQNAKKLLKYHVNKEKQKNNGYKNW